MIIEIFLEWEIELAQQVKKVLNTLAKGLGLVPITPIATHNYL